MKYTSKQIEKLLKDIHNGIVTDMNLPEDLYMAIGSYIEKGIIKGFGGDISDFKPGETQDLLISLQENGWMFSAAKTYQQVKEMVDLLVDENGAIKPYSQFKAEALAIYDQYNVNWLKAEYDTSIGMSQMSRRWDDILKQADILPMLTFSTAGHPCPECAPFEGLTAPVNSKIWDKCSPLLHFSCMCILIQSEDAIESGSRFIDDLPTDKISDVFGHNPGKTGEVFNKYHPYFADSPKELGKENFGLEIPKLA